MCVQERLSWCKSRNERKFERSQKFGTLKGGKAQYFETPTRKSEDF